MTTAGQVLEELVVSRLAHDGLTITTAESCTGGLLSGRLVNAPGASNVFYEGYITYSNESKERLLGVQHETLAEYGAVSRQTAAEMATGAAKRSGADAALSVTGIAGPGGGTAEKPVGLVYIGCFLKGRVTVKEFRFTGDRMENRIFSVDEALRLLADQLVRR